MGLIPTRSLIQLLLLQHVHFIINICYIIYTNIYIYICDTYDICGGCNLCL